MRSRPGSRQGAGGARKGDLWLVDAGRLRRRLLWSCHPGEQTGSFMVCRWLSPGGWLPTGGVWSCRRADPVNEPEGSSLQPRLADRAQAQSQRRVASGRTRRGRWGPRKAVQRPAQEWSQSWALEVRPGVKRGHGGARARAQEQWPGGPTRLEIAGREVPEQEGCRGPSVRRAAPCHEARTQGAGGRVRAPASCRSDPAYPKGGSGLRRRHSLRLLGQNRSVAPSRFSSRSPKPAVTGLAAEQGRPRRHTRAPRRGPARAPCRLRAWLLRNRLSAGPEQTAMEAAGRSPQEADSGKDTAGAPGPWKAVLHPSPQGEKVTGTSQPRARRRRGWTRREITRQSGGLRPAAARAS